MCVAVVNLCLLFFIYIHLALRFGKPIFEQSLSGKIQTENRQKSIFRAFFTEKKFYEPFDTNKKDEYGQ